MLILLETPLLSYVQKVKIALREKGPSFTTEISHELGSGRAGGTFKAANPRIEVPVLINGSVQIFESTVILECVNVRNLSAQLNAKAGKLEHSSTFAAGDKRH